MRVRRCFSAVSVGHGPTRGNPILALHTSYNSVFILRSTLLPVSEHLNKRADFGPMKRPELGIASETRAYERDDHEDAENGPHHSKILMSAPMRALSPSQHGECGGPLGRTGCFPEHRRSCP